jgi:predicted alpha/beta-fold hydrolase
MAEVGDFSNDATKLKQVVQSFAPSQFRPSYWTSNCHFQTIYGSGAIQTKLFGLPTRPFTTTPERFDTVDNDFFDVEYTEGFDDPRSDKSVIIVHGLESSIQGRLVTNFATAFIKKGFTCCLFSFRSCNGVENRYECHAVAKW